MGSGRAVGCNRVVQSEETEGFSLTWDSLGLLQGLAGRVRTMLCLSVSWVLQDSGHCPHLPLLHPDSAQKTHSTLGGALWLACKMNWYLLSGNTQLKNRQLNCEEEIYT